MQTQLRQAVVVAFGRTPYCKARKGSFAQLHPVEYGAQTLLGVLARVPQLRPEDIGDVINWPISVSIRSRKDSRLRNISSGSSTCRPGAW